MSSLDDQPPSHNTRSAIQIVWSCLFIIFTCTWTAIHPNVPPAKVSTRWWRKLWWRGKIMLWTLILPEMMVSWATFQWMEARKISAHAPKQHIIAPTRVSKDADTQSTDIELALIADKSSSHTNDPDAAVEWTRTHSYFLLMGGFAVSDPKDGESWIPIQADDVLDNKYKWPSIKEAHILNVTKGEAIAKIIVILQITWFVSHLCGRSIQHLAITELEIMTLAYALICAALYIIWFRKPYDVQQPIFVGDSTCCPTQRHLKPLSTLRILQTGEWLWVLQGQITGDSEFSSKTATETNGMNIPNLALLISGMLFGGVHLLSWSYEFPTQLEFWMWITASLCVSLIPFAFFLSISLWAIIEVVLKMFLFDLPDAILCMMFSIYASMWILVPILHNTYLIARIILFVQSFLLLRNLSSSATQAVSWSSFFPHV